MVFEAVEVAKNVWWVGAVDWNVRMFHGYTYSTHRGSTYNAYLIKDEKTCLVDTVYAPFAHEMLERIRSVAKPEEIDYLVANHVETDHSGAMREVLRVAPKTQVVCTQRCKEGLSKHYFGDWNYRIVKTGDELSLGKRRLRFVEAPMLHWPDSMFSYLVEEQLLLPNDAFGQHIATSGRFDDEVDQDALMEEAAKYYANILWPLSSLVAKKLEEVVAMGIPIKTIAPSHGIIWRKDPMKIVNAYASWARGAARASVVIAYDTMWSSTEKMAQAMLEGIRMEGMEAKLFRLPVTDRGDIVKEMLNSRGLLVGSATINRDILPTVAPLLEDLKGLRPVRRVGAAFGSYGWSGGAAEKIEKHLREGGVDVVMSALTVNWVPTEDELKKCVEFGRQFARKVAAAK